MAAYGRKMLELAVIRLLPESEDEENGVGGGDGHGDDGHDGFGIGVEGVRDLDLDSLEGGVKAVEANAILIRLLRAFPVLSPGLN